MYYLPTFSIQLPYSVYTYTSYLILGDLTCLHMCVTISILKYFRLECHEEESSYIAIATESKLPDANGNLSIVAIASLPGYTRLAMLCPFVSPLKWLDTLQLHRACIFHQLYNICSTANEHRL